MTSFNVHAHVKDVDANLHLLTGDDVPCAHVKLTLEPWREGPPSEITLFVYGKDGYDNVDDVLSKLSRQFTELASQVAAEARKRRPQAPDVEPPTGDEPTQTDLDWQDTTAWQPHDDQYDGAHEASHRRATFDGTNDPNSPDLLEQEYQNHKARAHSRISFGGYLDDVPDDEREDEREDEDEDEDEDVRLPLGETRVYAVEYEEMDTTAYCIECRQPDTSPGHAWTRHGAPRLLCYNVPRPLDATKGERVIATGVIASDNRLILDK